MTDLIVNRHTPRLKVFDNVLCVFEQNQEFEQGQAGEYPYYRVRCQK